MTAVDTRVGARIPAPQAEERRPSSPVLVCPDHDSAIRWREGERLQNLFEERCERLRGAGQADHLAVDAGDVTLTYEELDARANRLARHLLSRDVRPGERVALLFDRAVYSYVGMLAVLKVNAAYVPLDAGFPDDRLAYITQDAGVGTVLSQSHLQARLCNVDATVLCLDELEHVIAAEDGCRLTVAERGDPVDELCYIIYTSGSTGRPKGVAIRHASICNFVRVAVEVYGIVPADRIYQGMTIAFDFSVEEIWVPLVSGATLVPKPGASSLLGQDLAEFLQANRVTAMCCVPTLLATLDEDLPGLRFLLVSGEACPQDLVTRWHRPGRRFLNVYGPTEATVTATWALVHPDRPVTLGVPLPTYSALILDPGDNRALPPGEMGEIGIAGIGLAMGYVNRDDLTERAFIRDFLQIEGNPSKRIYRTGDLGRVNGDGEIEYHGRIDTQVKIRGYRIELSEIESVLMQVGGIAQAAVGTHEPSPGLVELVAYYSLREDTAGLDQSLIHQHLRDRLPAYMVPTYYEQLDAIPMLPSDKADRKRLPPPRTGRRLVTDHAYAAPSTRPESVMADALADVLQMERVSVDSHFFDDLGGNSLLMAHFCARVRRDADLATVSMKDIYQHPTIRKLAAALETTVAAEPTDSPPLQVAPPARTRSYVTCGALQLLVFLAYTYFTASVMVAGFQWIIAGGSIGATWVRSVAFSGGMFVVLSAVPILVKWLLVGRWRPMEIPVWSLAYLRFWVVKSFVRTSPMVLFVGTPLYVLYLRALGAKVGRDVAIFSRSAPVCTDLLTIGDGTVIRKDSSFSGYRALDGVIQTGAVTIGKDALVGEMTVLDIFTEMGDGAQLGHASALYASQAVPAGERWHGSPAQRTDMDYRAVPPTRCTTLRKIGYSVALLVNRFVLVAPVGLVLLSTLLDEYLAMGHLNHSDGSFYADLLVLSLVLFFGALVAGLVFVLTVPRLVNRLLTEDRVYPLYGFHYAVQRSVARLTGAGGYMVLFGDSSYIVPFLRALGYHFLRPIIQTGSNFGVALKHDSPYLCTIGSGTMVSDGLSIINVDVSNTSFRMRRTSIGSQNFFGNAIVFPPGGKAGDDCLLGTKAMVPLDGDVREGIGLLGSPCFEIPRSVQRDSQFDHLKTGEEFRRRLARKNRHNLVTMGLFLLLSWVFAFCTLLMASVGGGLYLDGAGPLAVVVFVLTMLLFGIAYFVLIERASTGFRRQRPQFCSIYDPIFWRHERFWKMMAPVAMFNGTPFKNVIMRMLGVRVGRRVFDDGCGIPEKTLVSIGDDCTLNAGSSIQCHSLEDGTFKLDGIKIGARCTLGVGAFVHYGVVMGEGSVLGPDSFLMKGEELVPHSRWGGNPAKLLHAPRPPASMAQREPEMALRTGYG